MFDIWMRAHIDQMTSSFPSGPFMTFLMNSAKTKTWLKDTEVVVVSNCYICVHVRDSSWVSVRNTSKRHVNTSGKPRIIPTINVVNNQIILHHSHLWVPFVTISSSSETSLEGYGNIRVVTNAFGTRPRLPRNYTSWSRTQSVQGTLSESNVSS